MPSPGTLSPSRRKAPLFNRTQRRLALRCARRAATRRHRRVIPGAAYFLTKKCDRDEFLTRPSALVNQILLYALLASARKYGVEILGFCFLSNHFHLVIQDVRGRMPDFMRDFLKETSAAIQIAEGDDRKVWSSKRYSSVELLDLDAAIRKCAYTVLNPARASLSRPEDWPGLTSAVYRAGEVLEARRPSVYFSNRRPETISTTLTPIGRAFGIQSEQRLKNVEQELQALVRSDLARIEDRLGRAARSYLGAPTVLRQSRDARGNTRVFDMNPRFASRDPERLRQAIEDHDDFERRHERARARWIRGHRDTVFPTGTFGFRMLYGVRVEKTGKVA